MNKNVVTIVLVVLLVAAAIFAGFQKVQLGKAHSENQQLQTELTKTKEQLKDSQEAEENLTKALEAAEEAIRIAEQGTNFFDNFDIDAMNDDLKKIREMQDSLLQ